MPPTDPEGCKVEGDDAMAEQLPHSHDDVTEQLPHSHDDVTEQLPHSHDDVTEQLPHSHDEQCSLFLPLQWGAGSMALMLWLDW
jgi:hypothetical protein